MLLLYLFLLLLNPTKQHSALSRRFVPLQRMQAPKPSLSLACPSQTLPPCVFMRCLCGSFLLVVLVICRCEDSQTSADLRGDGVQRAAGGAMTLAFVAALTQMPFSHSYPSLMDVRSAEEKT